MNRVLSLSISPSADRVRPPLALASAALIATGLALGLGAAPAEAGQAGSFRIAVLHYPAAWLSFVLYLAIAALSAITLLRNERAAAIVANAIAPTGILFTLIALWTEALWRKPIQGVWWVWDAQAVSQLMLMFLFGGIVALRAMIDDPRRADRAAALLALVGMANLPVLYFSIRWWDALHRGPRAAAPPMTGTLALACVAMGAGFAVYAVFAVLGRARCAVAEREVLERSMRELREARS
jgi:heme exporter protein C